MTLLGSLDDEIETSYELSDVWQQSLFRWGFPSWLIDYAAKKHYDWIAIIRDLHGGKVTHWIGSDLRLVARGLQESVLVKLTAVAMEESEPTIDRERLRLSLLLDGFELSNGKIVSVEGPVNLTKEKSRLLTTLEASSFGRKAMIAKHLQDAEDLFSDGKMHAAMSEARSAFQAGIEDTVSIVESRATHKAGGGLKNQIDFLFKENFVSADELQAFLAAWGFLSAGAHPGLPPDEAGRIGLIFGLEFTQVLLVKAKTLL